MLILSMAGALGSAQEKAAEEDCVVVGKPASLAGKLIEQKDYGPPGYGADPEADALEAYVLLVPAKISCVDIAPLDPATGKFANAQGVVVGESRQLTKGWIFQLIGKDDLFPIKLSPELLGRPVIVHGTVIEQDAVFHRAPLVIHFERAEPLP